MRAQGKIQRRGQINSTRLVLFRMGEICSRDCPDGEQKSMTLFESSGRDHSWCHWPRSLLRAGEYTSIPLVQKLASAEELQQRVRAVRVQIRGCALQTQNLEKGFDRYVRSVKSQQAVAATGWVEKGGWAVFMQQGNHRCVLSGCAYDRRDHEAIDDAWANLEPQPGKPNFHDETPFFPDAFPHVLEQSWDYVGNLNKFPGFARFSEFCRNMMEGFRKFATIRRFQSYAQSAAISRLRPVQDGLDYWQKISVAPTPAPRVSSRGECRLELHPAHRYPLEPVQSEAHGGHSHDIP
jgi:hypothetical protein